jgi:predicted HNH restriction endonuclease
VTIPEAWKKGVQQPFVYKSLAALGIDARSLMFNPIANELEKSDNDFPYANGTEGKRLVSKHLRIERDQKLPRMCKQRDGYKCYCCQLTMQDIYGEIGQRLMPLLPVRSTYCM